MNKQHKIENLTNTLQNYTDDPKNWKSFHCSNCGRFLIKECIILGSIQIKCRICKEINTLSNTRILI